jgi:3-dehydroquinate dehydratase-1
VTTKAAKALLVGGVAIAKGRLPAICVPLVARTWQELLDEASAAVRKSPDVLEWRVDHYGDIADIDGVVALARRVREVARDTPLIVTCRSAREGGAPTSLDVGQTVALYEAICAARCTEFIDYELGNGRANFARARDAAHAHGVSVIGSYHDFSGTPDASTLAATFERAKREGADVAKVAVTPSDPGDVLRLLDATWRAARTLELPLISMAMGAVGALSRIAGHLFGSALTFAAGESASAPGQIPVDELREAIAALNGAMRAR